MVRVQVVSGWSEDALTRLAASAESRSQHPIAAAVVEEAQRRDLPLYEVESFDSTTGLGVEARVEGRHVRVGSTAYVAKDQVSDAALASLEVPHDGNAQVWVAVDDKVAGAFVVSDRVRSSSASAIAGLHDLGITTIMATGDTADTARHIAQQVGITQVEAGLMPDGKVTVIRALQEKGHAVAMVGDGINDAACVGRSGRGGGHWCGDAGGR